MLEIMTAAMIAGAAHDIPLDLWMPLIYAESRFDPQATSETGCVGLAQIWDTPEEEGLWEKR